jgi:hypothetical protein
MELTLPGVNPHHTLDGCLVAEPSVHVAPPTDIPANIPTTSATTRLFTARLIDHCVLEAEFNNSSDRAKANRWQFIGILKLIC